MIKSSKRSWLPSLARRRRPSVRRPQPSTRLNLERFEERSLPSSSIPLNGFTWTSIGPSPIADGQSPGNPSSTGRLNGVALDPAILPGQSYPFASDPNTIYVASDASGVWRTTDGGTTWRPQSDFVGGTSTAITSVNRGVTDTVYAASIANDGSVLFEVSTDGGVTFAKSNPFPFGTIVTKLVAVPVNPMNQSQDLLYAAVSTNPFFPFGQGIYRSTDGGANWVNIVNIGTAPFSFSPVEFTDVAVDPTNPNVVYAAIGNVLGDGFNGVYRTLNAQSATPTWSVLIGGSQFLPGSTPGGIKIAISPVLPSVIFASVALRADPVSGFVPLLGVFRSTDSGANWTPTLIANPPQTNDPLNYMGISGEDNNVIIVDPFSPISPLGQRVITAGYGGSNNVLFSSTSTSNFTPIGVGSGGIGPYPNVHQAQFDQQGRMVIATGGGIYRLDSTAPVVWRSLNGTIGPLGLGVSQVHGFAISPTNPDRAIGNITSQPVLMQNAILFSDAVGLGNLAYGWRTVDAGTPPGIDGNNGLGVVIYNTFNPNIVYRVVQGSGNQVPVRRSTDGGLTWTAVGTGYQAYPFGGGFYTPALAMDPSRPNRLFSGYTRVFATDNNGDQWRTALQTTLAGQPLTIPEIPTTQITGMGGGPIPITALATGRQSNVDFGGFFGNGATIFAATTADAEFDPVAFTYENSAIPGATLYVAIIPDLAANQWPPQNTTYDNRFWTNITPPNIIGVITQIINDPTGPGTIYVYTSGGQIFRGSNFSIGYTLGGPPGGTQNIFIADPALTSITWDDLTGNLPPGSAFVSYPQPMALDKNIAPAGGGTFTDRMYVGTVNGVWSLDNPAGVSGPPVWQQVGLDSGGAPSLPAAPVSVLQLNPTTGILAAATYGRGVYELQIRGLIRGRVFEDINGNGQFDTGEPPFAGLTVRVLDLDNNQAEIAATITDANGIFEFRSLRAGNYRIVVSGSGNLFQTTAATDFPNFTEQSTFDGPTLVNIGFFRAASISGTKFNDINANGIFDPGEPGVAGFVFFVDANNNGVFDTGELSATSNFGGGYTFSPLGPGTLGGAVNPATFNGTYIIREVPQAGWQQTTPNPGPIVLLSGQVVTGINFGNIRPGLLSGITVTANGAGGLPLVVVRNASTNAIKFSFNAYHPSFRGGVTVAVGDINGDTAPDIVTAAGSSGGPHVRVYDGVTAQEIFGWMAYEITFTGGVYVAIGDIDGNGVNEVITGTGEGGGPLVKVFNPLNGQMVRSFFAYDPNFRGGVTVAAGDMDGDGRDDIATGAGPGGGPHVEVFSGVNNALLFSDFPYSTLFRGGVFVAMGDVNGDGRADLTTGPGLGGGAHIITYDGATQGLLYSFLAFTSSSPGLPWSSGAHVASYDVNLDGVADLALTPGRGQQPRVKILDGLTLSTIFDFTATDPTFLGGIFVGGSTTP
jgi:hypothetical protein